MNAHLIDLSPLAQLLLLGGLAAAVLLLWQIRRSRGRSTPQRLQALTLLTLFLTFDLVLFGSFTRLTDSGLGCPDWPGCYGSATPLGARSEIAEAEAAMPTGPVTHSKAWIEMIHRYLASAVGALITAHLVWTLLARRKARRLGLADDAAALSPGWSALTLVWVLMQGAFGALTVTMKLYPAIVTGHLLGGVGLLALLAAQASRQRHTDRPPLADRRRLVWAATGVLILTVMQVALGGWVSTNYAVLACTDFPTCQGVWWPTVDFHSAFQWQRELGQTRDGAGLPFAALTAIHLTHRLAAIVVSLAVLGLAWMLWRQPDATARRCGQWLVGTLVWQIASGVSNVVLGWPLAAAVAHTGGAAVLVATMAALLASPLVRRPVAHATADTRREAGTGPATAPGLSLHGARHAAR